MAKLKKVFKICPVNFAAQSIKRVTRFNQNVYCNLSDHNIKQDFQATQPF